MGNNDYGGEYADYQDYANDEYGQEQDGLYYDYAESHQPKKGTVVFTGTGGVLKIAASSMAVGIMGAKFHAGRAIKELKRKHKSEQKNYILNIIMMYINLVNKM